KIEAGKIEFKITEVEFEPLIDECMRTVETMAAQIGRWSGAKVADLGAGYGGSARWLAKRHGCSVTCINLSEVQNERNRRMNEEAGLSEQIEVIDASFEKVPAGDQSFDVVWSQDSFLHSDDRETVMDEVDRILKPGGEFIFTDPMQADDCPAGSLQPVLDRLHLESLASIGFYRQQAKRLGWTEVAVNEQTAQLVNHYTRVRQELATRREELQRSVSEQYIDRMIAGLGHWIDAGDRGLLSWGILHFRKPA
ncbi:MAG: class I SAM-dependent methyltransferase, partial [Gammaproteobacteria bacterium]|nr:class I SAM-dependent methyltransferase [Gammaproteobacteria bacterium]